MEWPFRRYPPSELQRELLVQVTNAIQNPNFGPGRFAPRDSLAKIWTAERLQRFFHHDLCSRQWFIRDIRRNFLQTISILISVNWDDWSRFDEIFFSHQGSDGTLDRTDHSLRHYNLQSLRSDSFLGPVFGSLFFDARYIFCPIDIEEGSNLSFEDGWRLPFLPAESQPRGRGGFGLITREVIAARHYYRSGNYRYGNNGGFETDVEVARKRFDSKLDFDRERLNLERIRDSVAQHKRIVLPIATVTIGHQFNILFPLARMDLKKFLEGGLISPEQCDMNEMIDEATHLADALDHLHNRLGVFVRGYHMDLKPANILVYGYPEPQRQHGVGKWMITDFGLSIIERLDCGGSTDGLRRDPDTETMTRLQRMEGAYRAPEVGDGRISRRSDVWSFGCILVRVFAFKLDGIQRLQSLDELRRMNDDGVGPYCDDYFARGSPLDGHVLNPHIENWIRNLPYHRRAYSDEFLRNCAELLLSTLKINKNDRPDANKVKDALGSLKVALHRDPRPSSSLESISELRSEGPDPFQSRSSSVSDQLSPPIFSPVVGLAIMTEDLVDAIKRNDLGGVERVLGQNIHIDKPDKVGNTPLGIAVTLRNETLVRRLLEANASVDARDVKGKTPLMIAVRNGHIEMARLLLEMDADCTVYSDEGLTCLHYATLNNVDVSLLRLLIDQRFQSVSVDIPTKGPEQETPLMMLIKHFVDNDSWEDKFMALVDAGADVNRRNGFRTTPLRCAVSEGFIRAANLLIENKANWEDFSTVPGRTHAMSRLLEWAWPSRRQSIPRGISRYFFWRRSGH
ncbi:isoform 2 of receptor-interacting serine/threonine-protein kinase 4 [Aspergillus udagawae]|nr:isoform 2 of receptor-interacting serine/threonine-protein kinase 4 [Aspergillus udagawae]